MDLEVEGIQGRGRPKLTWREVVRRLGLNEGEAENRSQWRKKIKGHGNLALNPGDVPGCPRVLQGGVPQCGNKEINFRPNVTATLEGGMKGYSMVQGGILGTGLVTLLHFPSGHP